MAAGLEIVRAQPKDFEGMKELFERVAYPHYARKGDARFNEQLLLWLRNKAATLPNDLALETPPYWVARRDGSVVGMCGYTALQSKIHSMYVSERRTGIGTQLMKAALSAPEAVFPVLAHVVDTNVTAQDFYSRLGFTDSGERGFWGLDAERAIGMDYIKMHLTSPLLDVPHQRQEHALPSEIDK